MRPAPFLAALIIALLLIPSVLSVGITPTKKMFEFEPSGVLNGEFTVINSDQKDVQLLITAQGPLAQYILLQDSLVDMKADEGTRDFAYKINLPASFDKPGLHEAEIVVTRLASKDAQAGAYVGTTVGVATQVKIRVPYPGKYAESRLDISEAGVNETVSFVMPVANLGVEDITNAKGTIAVLGSTNQNIATVVSTQKAIKAKTTEELRANWLADVNPGIYAADATVTYDEKVLTLKRTFAVGNLIVDLISAQVKDFKLGGIAKIILTVQNKWNSPVNDLYAELYVYDSKGSLLSVTKSPTLNLASQSTDTLSVYWDTQGLPAGTYSAKTVLHYADKKTEKPLTLVVGASSLDAQIVGATGKAISEQAGSVRASPVSLIFILEVAFVLVNIGLFFYFRKKLQKQN